MHETQIVLCPYFELVSAEAIEQYFDQSPITYSNSLVESSDLIASMFVLCKFALHFWLLFSDLDDVLKNLDTLLLDGEIEKIEATIEFKLDKVLHRHTQALKCSNIIVTDCDQHPLEGREMLSCDISAFEHIFMA